MLKCKVDSRRQYAKFSFTGTNRDLFIELVVLLNRIQNASNADKDGSGDELLRELVATICDHQSPLFAFKGFPDIKETETTIKSAECGWAVYTSTEEE